MKRKRYTEEQIIAILREAETGGAVVDLCRKHGMSNACVALCSTTTSALWAA
jgi:putative transposase